MIKAKEVMNTCVIMVHQDEDIYEAMRTMALNKITGLPVVDDTGKLMGIITEKDVLVLLYHSIGKMSTTDTLGKVRDFMTRRVVCFGPDDSLRNIAECLSINEFRRVPILDQGRLVGIISRRDVIKHIQDLQRRDEVLKDSILEVLY